MVENAEITDLKVKPGHVITVKENGGILAGRAKHSVIRNVTVNGTLRTTGTVGGVTADVLEDSVVENCVSDHVAIVDQLYFGEGLDLQVKEAVLSAAERKQIKANLIVQLIVQCSGISSKKATKVAKKS